MKLPITEKRARTIETTKNMLGLAAVVLGGIWTLFTYFQTRRLEADTAALQADTAAFEAKKPFEAKRLEFCEWATTHTSAIVSSSNQKDVANHTEAYWGLLFGLAAMAEDEKVLKSMIQFGRCLKNQANCSVPLKQLSLNLANDCRDSIATNWKVKLSGYKVSLEELDAPAVTPSQ
jgi:hypothetical protein